MTSLFFAYVSISEGCLQKFQKSWQITSSGPCDQYFMIFQVKDNASPMLSMFGQKKRNNWYLDKWCNLELAVLLKNVKPWVNFRMTSWSGHVTFWFLIFFCFSHLEKIWFTLLWRNFNPVLLKNLAERYLRLGVNLPSMDVVKRFLTLNH